MLIIKATVVNVFQTPTGRNKEGQAFGGEWKVQLQGENLLKNGERRIELITLTTRKPDLFRDNMGKEVRVPVGAFPTGRTITYFLNEETSQAA